jgi:hypothetical protein
MNANDCSSLADVYKVASIWYQKLNSQMMGATSGFV